MPQTRTVYYPCSTCDGQGYIIVNNLDSGITSTGGVSHNEMCPSCNGTGKGNIKEIIEVTESNASDLIG